MVKGRVAVAGLGKRVGRAAVAGLGEEERAGFMFNLNTGLDG